MKLTCQSGNPSDSALMGVRPPPEGWVLPPQPGKLNAIKLDTFLGMPGRHVLTLDCTQGAFRVFASGSTNGTPLLVAGQSATNGLPPDIWVESLAHGTATLRYTYTGEGAASNFTHHTAFPLSTTPKVTLPLITPERTPSGNLYNPYGIALGGSAWYKMGLLPPTIPDSDIVWNATQGNVSFPHGNTGRIVAVQGDGLGAFTLEATIGGLTPKPTVFGEVLTPVNVAVTVWIVRDNNGSNASVTPTQVINKINEANLIQDQVAMVLNLSGGIHYTNRTDWLIMDTSDAANDVMKDLPNYGNGLKVCFISEISSGVAGVNSTNCIIITLDAKPNTLPHEVGHTCGLWDIYIAHTNNFSLPDESPSTESIEKIGPTKAEYMHPKDWGSGYYPVGFLHTNLVMQLLMYGYAEDDALDIPCSDVYGVDKLTEKGMVPVGFKRMKRNPQHLMP